MRGSKSNGSKHTNGTKPVAFSASIALLIAALAAPALLPSDEPGECPHDEAACAFAGSYEAARAQFRSLSRASGASLFAADRVERHLAAAQHRRRARRAAAR